MRITIITLSFFMGMTVHAQENTQQNTIKIDAAAALQGKVRLLLGVVSAEHDAELAEFAAALGRDLGFSGQFDVTRMTCALVRTEKEITQFFDQGYGLVLYLSRASDHAFEWRLYDASQAQMLKGKRYEKRGSGVSGWARALAHDLWPVLTGSEGWFLTKIAHIRKKGSHYSRRSYTVCVTDYDGEHNVELVTSKRPLIAPSWTRDMRNPQLIFSECTSSNVRLMGVDMSGHKRIVLDRDGTNVGVSFAPFTDDVVYGHSGQIWSYWYDKQLKKGVHVLLINDSEVCASPVLLEGGDVIYCCGGKIKRYCAATKKSAVLTPSGYCVAPAYCERTQMLVYSKRVGQHMQLFVYDMRTKEHRQLTKDAGNKLDASWSPCGTYVVFCHENGATSRIALEQVRIGRRVYITPESLHCSGPVWTAVY